MIKEHDFNKILHRKIKAGTEFKNLIPEADRSEIFFEKSQKEVSESDVFDTLENMAFWSRKHAYQMQKMAPLLQGATKAQTIRNIFSWLYWHFQYKLDDATGPQNLYSPQSAYANRFEGFDCKSFSILTSTILQCLQIDHSFRMVKQVGLRSKADPKKWIIDPNNWSHVYVIVQDGKLYHVIDATTHDNKEVKFRLKHDYPMLHRGLNAPVTQSLGCCCNGKSTSSTGLGNPQTLGFAITNFHKYLDNLEKQGVSREITNNMLALVKYNVERGIDPNMDEIFKKATSGGQLGASVVGGLISQGVGSVKSSAASAISNISIGGVKATDVAAAAMGDPTAVLSIAKGALSKIIPAGFVSSTFGAVFANGMNISCWGSAYNPNTAKDDITKYYGPYWQQLLDNIVNTVNNQQQHETAINFALSQLTVFIQHYKRVTSDTSYASCSRSGWKKLLELAETVYNQSLIPLINEYKTLGGAVVSTTIKGPITMQLPTYGPLGVDVDGRVNTSGIKIDLTNFYKKANAPVIPISTSKPIKGTLIQPGRTLATGVKGTVGDTKKTDGKGINPLILLSVAGIVAKIVL